MGKKVSFDFDGTLSRIDVQKYAKRLIKDGFEVWVVTARDQNSLSYDNFDLFEVTDRVGISRNNIVFWGLQSDKSFFFKDTDFIWHLDDDWLEVDAINKYCENTIALCPLSRTNWLIKCDDLLYTDVINDLDKAYYRKRVNELVREFDGDVIELLEEVKSKILKKE